MKLVYCYVCMRDVHDAHFDRSTKGCTPSPLASRRHRVKKTPRSADSPILASKKAKRVTNLSSLPPSRPLVALESSEEQHVEDIVPVDEPPDCVEENREEEANASESFSLGEDNQKSVGLFSGVRPETLAMYKEVLQKESSKVRNFLGVLFLAFTNALVEKSSVLKRLRVNGDAYIHHHVQMQGK